MLKRGLWILASLILGAGVLAQATDCPEFMYEYIEQTAALCAATGRNEICYGSNAIEVQLTDSSTAFGVPGDITALANVDSIRTSGLDEATQEFGMALLQVQADVEGALPGQVVTFLLMGNVSVDGINEGEAPMQAFRFNTGIGAPTCESSNYDALMIDSPDGLTINFTVNGVDIELGSTAIIVGKPDNKIDMLVLEGHGRVTAMGQTVEVEEGFWTQIPMDVETGNEAVGAPEEPVPFGLPRVIHLPLNVIYAGQNIALNKPVQVDAALEANPATNLVNGIEDDSWQAEAGSHVLEIDLLQEYSIERIRIKGVEGLEAAAYDVYVGDAAGNYSLANSFAPSDGGDEWLSFEAPVPLLFVRHIRIEANSENAVGLAEVEVYASGFYGCVVSAAAANTEATNLRAEANTYAEILGAFGADDRAIAVGQAVDGEGQTWWELEGGAWIRGDRVVGRGSCTFLPEA
jgi:hypothetical protein